jgi:hypothetical protein
VRAPTYRKEFWTQAAAPRALDLGAVTTAVLAGALDPSTTIAAVRPGDPGVTDRARGRFTRASTHKKFSVRRPRRDYRKQWGGPSTMMSLGAGS